MRALVERLRLQFPHAGEGRVVQAHAAVGREHRDRFGQMVERFALHLDQRVVAPMHVEPLGDVVVEIGDAAFRIGRGDDAQRAPVGQVPEVLLRLGGAIGLVQLALPLPEVLFLRQFALRAQLVEHGVVGRVLVEQAGVELAQRAEGGVVEGELAVGGEDGDAGGEPVEHAAVRVDQPRHAGAHAFRFGAVDGDAGAAAAARRIDDVERAPLAGNDRRQPAAVAFAGGAGTRHFLAAGAVEQFEFARHRVGRVGCLDRAGIGGVDEDQPAAVVARPDRGGQRVEQRAHGVDIGQQRIVTGGEIDQVALDAADVAQAQHRAAADGAAFGLDRTAGGGGERHDEAAAVAAQLVDRVLHALGGGRFQPGAESEHALARRAGHDDAGVAENIGRFLARRRPGDDHLRLRQQQRLEPVDLGVERHRLVARAIFDALGTGAGAQQHDG